MSGHQYQCLVGGYGWKWNFLEVASMVVTWEDSGFSVQWYLVTELVTDYWWHFMMLT